MTGERNRGANFSRMPRQGAFCSSCAVEHRDCAVSAQATARDDRVAEVPCGLGGTTGTPRRLSGRTVERSRAAHRGRGRGTASAKTEKDLSEMGGAVARRDGRPSTDRKGERSLRKLAKRITSKSFHAKTGGGDRGQGSRSAGSAYSRESRALLLCSRSPDGSVSELDAIMCSR